MTLADDDGAAADAHGGQTPVLDFKLDVDLPGAVHLRALASGEDRMRFAQHAGIE